ncbi:MAG: DNA-processing protein DprA [Chitinophagia bacterium]|jgi:DNA processing protein
MTASELRDNLSLCRIPQIGDIYISQLIRYAGSASALFAMGRRRLELIPGIGSARANAILHFKDHVSSEKEIQFAQRNGIEIIVKGMKDYPSRLEHCHDAPHVLFFKGNQSLNHARIIGVVGTRSPTAYGRERTIELLSALSQENILVLSGLAYGIDTIAHQEALKAGLPTIGVLGHGLDKIYPYANRHIASEMLAHGGLLTEFWHGTKPDRQNFPKRNRIVSGLADALVVIESGEKGGSLITADIANSYNKDVFAFPGRVTDVHSKGCNELIRNHQAQLISSGRDLLEMMNWIPRSEKRGHVQPVLFPELGTEEKLIYDILHSNSPVPIDLLHGLSGLRSSELAAILLSMELKGIIHVLPGKTYALSVP